MSNSNTLPSVLYYESTTETNDIDKANLFNSFHSVFTVSSCSFNRYTSLPDSSLCSTEILKSDIFQILVSLDTSKAIGDDGIPPLILKHSAT